MSQVKYSQDQSVPKEMLSEVMYKPVT